MPVLSFLNAALLAGLAAIAAPLLIHLIYRRRLPEIRIPSTWLLREVRRENVRQVKLHDYILLALRMLIVALLALAAARPALQRAGILGGGGGESAVAVVLDATLSMNASAPGGGQVFAAARRRAEEIVRQTSAGDAVTLVIARGGGGGNGGGNVGAGANADNAHAIAGRDVINGREAVLAALRAVTPELTAGTLGPAVAEALRRVDAQKRPNREVYVVSDFQKQAMNDVAHDAATLARGVRVVLAPPSAEPRGNLALESASAHDAGSGLVRVSVANHSPEGTTVPVRLEATGLVGSEVALAISARERATATLRDPLAAAPAGITPESERATLPSDALGEDNVRFLVPRARSVVRVLIIGEGGELAAAALASGAPVTPADIPAAAFAKLALQAGGAAGPGATYAVEVRDGTALLSADPSRYDVVVLADPPRMPAAALRALSAYMQAGGGVLLACGAHTDPAVLNAEILPALLPSGGGGATATGIVRHAGAGSYASLLPSVPDHPVFAGFRLTRGGALTGGRFEQYVAIAPGKTLRVLARFSDHTPALLEGPGVLVFASAFDLVWGDFPTTGSFLPFLRQSAGYLATGHARPQSERTVGDALTALAPAGTSASGARCTGPNGADLGVHARVDGHRTTLLTDPVPAPGVWTLRAGERVLDRFAVNVDVRESDLARPAPRDLIRLSGRSSTLVMAPGERVASVVQRLRHGRELWRELLILALILMAVEVWMARTRRAAVAEPAAQAA